MKLAIIPAMALMALSFTAGAVSITSPDGDFRLNVDVNAQGEPCYSLSFKGRPVVTDSRLGIVGAEAKFDKGFSIEASDTTSVDRTWTPVWGEYGEIRDHFNELAVTFVKPDPEIKMTVRFRLFDDGLGFRYELPLQPNVNYFAVDRELTEFNFTDNHGMFVIPGDYDTDEYLFSETDFSGVADAMKKYRGRHTESQAIERGVTVQTPMLLKTKDNKPLYISLHEAALVGYPAMSLDVDTARNAMSAHLTPDRLGVAAYLQLPFSTPWRTMIVSDDARDILASQLVLNLNEPSKIEDTSWIKPMKFVGVWWEMFTGRQKTWA